MTLFDWLLLYWNAQCLSTLGQVVEIVGSDRIGRAYDPVVLTELEHPLVTTPLDRLGASVELGHQH